MRTPSSRQLYRTVLWSVICLAICGAAIAQIAKKTPKSTGPRALGLVERLVNGKTRLQAICIMVDGKFYDAGTYKATPVPMSLGVETVYEGMRTGISKGLFTVTDARTVRGNWFGEGRWVAAGSEIRKVVPTPTKPVDDDAPPILRRSSVEPKKTVEPKPADSKPADSKPANKESPDKAGDAGKAAAKNSASAATSDKAPPSSPPAAPAVQQDRPLLRRSKPGDAPQKFVDKDFSVDAPIKESFLAVSDVAGPEPRPYRMDLKPDEILADNKKVMEMASETAAKLYPAAAQKTAPTAHAKKPAPHVLKFINPQMQVFDLTNSNDPVIVFTATVDPSEKIAAKAGKLTVTVIARVDIYGELRKLLAEATDDHHLDLYPRLEFLDAIDADGDANGELVFREGSDSGQGFVVYRAGMDRLWPVFDSLRNY